MKNYPDLIKILIVFFAACAILILVNLFIHFEFLKIDYTAKPILRHFHQPSLSLWTTFPASPTYYVSDSLGNDAWDGTVPAYQGGVHGPEKTVQAGLDDLCSGGPPGS